MALDQYALMSSGGKDSTLALDRARRQGFNVRCMVNIYHGPSKRVAFHGVRSSLIAAQAVACGLEHLTAATGPDEYEPVFLRLLDEVKGRGLTGIIFGNIHLDDVRAWFECRVTAAGLEHVEPLWGDPPAEILREVIERGFRAVVVSVDNELGAGDLLGKELDTEFLTVLAERNTIDPCGEGGEYHSFVYDGPTFSAPMQIVPGDIRIQDHHRLLDLTLSE